MNDSFELDGFEPIKLVGGGGFGNVWLARQTNVDRRVAVKVGHTPIQDETIKLRFDRECKALGRLSGHPNIVDVYTAGSLDDERPYLVLEYISGGTLWQRLKRSPMTDEELIAVGAQLAGALHVAHTAGVLHRDLKPENILIRANGDAVLGDFGIARLQDGVKTTSAAITASVAYAAPEVLGGKRATVASDLYGVGVCLLAAVIRSVPFVDKADSSIHPIINRVMGEQHPDIRERGISEELAVVIDSLLEKNPADRPSTAAELQARLEGMRARRLLANDATLQTATPRTDRGQDRAGRLVAEHREQTQLRGPVAEAVAENRLAPNPTPAQAPAAQAQPQGQGQAPAAADPGGPPPGSPQRRGPRPSADRSLADQAPSQPARPSSGLRSFAMAYAATLIIGGVLLYLAIRLLSGDGDSDSLRPLEAPAHEAIIVLDDTVATSTLLA